MNRVQIHMEDVQYISRISKRAVKAHSDTNHFYDTNLPYDFHLRRVVKEAERYIHLIKDSHEPTERYRRVNAVAACWFHDTIEDTRLSYNNIVTMSESNYRVAEMVRAVTNYNRGRTRAERMPDWLYQEIRETEDADFVKLCDRIANIKFSLFTESAMFHKYAQEHEDFIKKVTTRRVAFMPMIVKLKELVQTKF